MIEVNLFYPKLFTRSKTRFGTFRKFSVDMTTKVEYTERRREGEIELMLFSIFLLGFGMIVTIQEKTNEG